MADTFSVEIDPPDIQLEGTPVEVVVTIHNLDNVVEEYTVRVEGLDPDWYDAPAAALALFPQDREQAHLHFHAPQHSDLREGTYL